MFVVIVNIIGVIYSIVQLVDVISTISDLRDYNMSSYSSVSAPTGWLMIGTVLMAVTLIGAIIFIAFIIRKNPNFVLVFHVITAIDILAALLIFIAVGSFLSRMGVSAAEFYSTSIGALIGAIAGLILWTMYFSKSIRVRTYMGSDEYLRRSPLTRNVLSPMPADGSYGPPTGVYPPPYTPPGPGSYPPPPVQTFYCGNCGAEIPGNSDFCGTCGARKG